MEYSDMLGLFVPWGIVNTLFWGGVFFASIIVMYMMFRGPKKVEDEALKEPEEKEEDKKEEETEEGGSEEGEEDHGEEDKEEKEEEKVEVLEEFECTECGATVSGDAEKCPSCGEAFEDD
jgi:rubrerythrin